MDRHSDQTGRQRISFAASAALRISDRNLLQNYPLCTAGDSGQCWFDRCLANKMNVYMRLTLSLR